LKGEVTQLNNFHNQRKYDQLLRERERSLEISLKFDENLEQILRNQPNLTLTNSNLTLN
jgi:hypothetical protein